MKIIIRSVYTFFVLVPLLIVLSSCSSGLSSVYDFDYPLTTKTAKSNSTRLQIQIPQGWYVGEDNEFKTTDIWLVKEDYSATIKFVAVTLDDETAESFASDELGKVVELNKILLKAKLGKNFKGFTNEETFSSNYTIFSAYQYLDEKDEPVRTVVFKNDSKFYEVTAFALKSANPAEIFKAQNSVLASLK
ncbi:MAG: hypothetical protein HYZ10_11430 [Ignavibacteriales bacterium]|nr:hypothetical protein [Ignavibacteriales bacterium]